MRSSLQRLRKMLFQGLLDSAMVDGMPKEHVVGDIRPKSARVFSSMSPPVDLSRRMNTSGSKLTEG